MKYIFLTLYFSFFSIFCMEECGQFLKLKKTNEVNLPQEVDEIYDVQELIKLATENKKERKFVETAMFLNRFVFRLVQDLSCAQNPFSAKIQQQLEERFRCTEKKTYEKFVEEADTELINKISRSSFSWAKKANEKNLLPNPKWLESFQQKIEFYPEEEWQEKRNEALEQIRKEFEDFPA